MSTEPTGLRAAPTGPAPAVSARVSGVDAPPTDGAAPPRPPPPSTVSSPPSDGHQSDGRRPPTESAPPVSDDPRRSKPKAERDAPPAPPRRKRKVRKVHRVVHHVEVWSVAKITAVFVACGYVTVMISGYLLWRAADRVGTIDGIEGFMEDSGGYDTYQILGDVVFKVAGVTLAVLALLTIAVAVLGSVLFNLVSDITGGIRMTVIDEDLIVAPARRPEAETARRPEAETARRPEAETARRPEAETARRPEAEPARRPEAEMIRPPGNRPKPEITLPHERG